MSAHRLKWSARRPAPFSPTGVRPGQTVVTALGIQQIIAWGSTYYLLAVLAPSIHRDMGWSSSWIFGAMSAALLLQAAAAPFVGVAIDRWGGRNILSTGVVTIASGLLLLASAHSYWLFVSSWLLLGLGMGCALYDSAFSTLGQMYDLEARRLITALTLWGGFSITLCWPISTYLLDTVGWRGTAVAYAAFNLVISLPLIMGVLPGGIRSSAFPQRLARRKVVLLGNERRAFLVLAAIQTLSGFVVTFVSVHLLTMLEAQGKTQAEAVAIAAIIGPAQFSSRILELAGRGRQHPIWTLIAALALNAVGLGLLAARTGPAAVALFFFAGGNGLLSIARGALPLAMFGGNRYPVLVGRLSRPSLIAQAIAPTVGSILLFRLGANAAFLTVLCASSTGLLLALRLLAIRPR